MKLITAICFSFNKGDIFLTQIGINFKRKAAKTQSFYFMNTEKTKENIPLCLCAFVFEKEN